MTAHHHAPHAHAEPDPDLSPAEHWERRYSASERVWSGKVNLTMSEVVSHLAPGRAIDLGRGEGGDVLWLAEQGWTAHGLDISATAVGRARGEAAARGLDGASFEAVDLDAWEPKPATVDLVTANFFQSKVALDRTAILRRAMTARAPMGAWSRSRTPLRRPGRRTTRRRWCPCRTRQGDSPAVPRSGR
ncbi:class I SAM-dependent methyltransferase [Brachybacterium sp. GPGPB12]|uniref:class I SAM-dependent methyltransferase n=1 Tax=Brachybacterium sp. GPGPB12 TaxID=3023517 RepID=UPI003134387A